MSGAPNNSPPDRTRLTDSAWFWVMLFSCMSLAGMQLLDWKYNEVQSRLERQFQGRQWAAQHGAQVQMNPEVSTERAEPVPVVVKPEHASAGQEPATTYHGAKEAPTGDHPSVPTYSQPGQLVISLWPLRSLAIAVLVISSVLLWRQTRPNIPPAEKQA